MYGWAGCNKEYKNDWNSQIALNDFYNWTPRDGFSLGISIDFLVVLR